MNIRFISEIGSNHNQHFTRALKLIITAKAIGCWGVKFQLFSTETLYSKECQNELRKVKDREFPLEWLPEIYKFTKKSEIALGYSIFHESFIDKVVNYCDFLKISSWDVLRLDLIKKCWATGLPLYISLGGADENELRNILNIKTPTIYNQINFLHCVPKYPTKPEECNLNMINRIFWFLSSSSSTGETGWSDHTKEPGVIYKAIECGASFIEFHLDLNDGLGAETLYGHVWFPQQIKEVIDNVEIGEKAKGDSDSNRNKELFQQERMWRASPNDGLRPLEEIREQL